VNLKNDGYGAYSIWEHSQTVTDLYRKRAADRVEEMTCAAQAADLLKPVIHQGESLLDVGCGSGHFFHSLRKKNIPVDYYGIDASEKFIRIGQQELKAFALSPERLKVLRLEDLNATMDHVVCLNVLSNLDNYPRYLERILLTAQKTVLIRESLKEQGEYKYVRDNYLDKGVDLKVHVNAYPVEEVKEFIRAYGFSVTEIVDKRTGGQEENVIDYPHYWKFLMATKLN